MQFDDGLLFIEHSFAREFHIIVLVFECHRRKHRYTYSKDDQYYEQNSIYILKVHLNYPRGITIKHDIHTTVPWGGNNKFAVFSLFLVAFSIFFATNFILLFLACITVLIPNVTLQI